MKSSARFVLPMLLVSALAAGAQMPMPGSPAGINAALTRVFGDIKAFSARADARVLDKNQAEKVATPMEFALLDGNIRVEIDVTQVKSREMSEAAAASMKQFGMDRLISIIRPDKKTTFIIFPAIQAYTKMPMAREDVEALTKEPKIEKTALGKETINSHACVKNKVVITDSQGRKDELTLWNAADLKDFPVQIQTTERGETVLMRFKDVKLARPDAKQFDPPAGFQAYDDIQALMQGVMMKMMGSGGLPKK